MHFLREFLEFLQARRKPWLLPIFLILFIMGGLIVVTQGTVLAPLVYTLF